VAAAALVTWAPARGCQPDRPPGSRRKWRRRGPWSTAVTRLAPWPERAGSRSWPR